MRGQGFRRLNLSPSYTSAQVISYLHLMTDHSKFYVTGAFILGAVLSIVYQNAYLHSDRKETSTEERLGQQQKLLSKFSKINDLDTLKKSLAEIEQVLEKGGGNIKDGIEGCIGDTPLIKIKSLSDATGCEILAKAEVFKLFSA